MLILSSITWGSPFNYTLITATWYNSNINITNTQHRSFPDIIVKNQSRLLNILLETNIIFLNIHVLNTLFFVDDNAFYSFWQYFVFYCSLILILHPFAYLKNNTTWCTLQQKHQFQKFVLVIDNWRSVHYHALIIIFFNAYHAHFCLKY